jgi:hypothetical protein
LGYNQQVSDIPTRRLPPAAPVPPARCPRCDSLLESQEVQQWGPNPAGLLPRCLTYARLACPQCAYRDRVGLPLPSHWDEAAYLVAAAWTAHPTPETGARRALLGQLRRMLAADTAALALWEGSPPAGADPRQAAIRARLERADTPYHPLAWFQQAFTETALLWETAAHTAPDPFRQALARYYQGLSLLVSDQSGAALVVLETAYRTSSPALQATVERIEREWTWPDLLGRQTRDPQAIRHFRRHSFRRRASPILRFAQGLETLADQLPPLGLNLWIDLPLELSEWLDPFDEI